jgi:hypothetical protein
VPKSSGPCKKTNQITRLPTLFDIADPELWIEAVSLMSLLYPERLFKPRRSTTREIRQIIQSSVGLDWFINFEFTLLTIQFQSL